VHIGLLAGFGLFAAACSPGPVASPPPSAPSPTTLAARTLTIATCAPPASREIAFTAPDAKDVLTIEAIGAACAEASVHVSIRKADGKLVWSYAVPVSHTWAMIPDDDKPPVAEKQVPAYMAEILKVVAIRKTSEAPDWPKGKERPEDPGGLFYSTDDARDYYLETRAKGLPMFCFEPTMGVGQCVAYHVEDNYAAAYYEGHS
jgi:hypothetical protein